MSKPFLPIETASLIWKNGLPFSKKFNDIYFSMEGGLQETDFVFINGNQLIERWKSLETDTFVIAEMGFGTGLNFLLTWSLWLKYAPASARLFFLSCEKYPLTKNDCSQCLQLWPQLKKQIKSLIDNYPILTEGFHHLELEGGRVHLTLMLGDALACFNELLLCNEPQLESQLRINSVDAWYLDGFSPAKNEAMWSEELFYTMGLLSKPGTTLATFSSASLVKKNLEQGGFLVIKKKGFGSKRHMLVGEFKKLPKPTKTNKRITPWYLGLSQKIKEKQAIVLGAGLAGCYTAYALAKRNWQVTLVDAKQEVGCGASANPYAVLYPNLSNFQSPLTQYMLASFLYSATFYKKLLRQNPIGELSGILQLAHKESERRAQATLESWLRCYPELGGIVELEQASELAGIPLKSGGLFIPLAGWINSKALCQWLSQHPSIHFEGNTQVKQIHFEKGHWQVGSFSSEVLIIANGYQAAEFSQTNYLPIKPIRGQMTSIASNDNSKKLKIPLCAEGHVLPSHSDQHAIGATFQLGVANATCKFEDNLRNFHCLEKISENLPSTLECKASWTAIRGATPDYLPLVGQVPCREEFERCFQALKTNAKRWLPHSAPMLQGLYLCAGFGSRGLATIPLAAEWLVSLINQDAFFMPRTLIQALSPARFLRKKIIKSI